jgi:glutamate-1-semialdehyde aminotransferase
MLKRITKRSKTYKRLNRRKIRLQERLNRQIERYHRWKVDKAYELWYNSPIDKINP